jgi:phosphoglycerol transferase
LTLACILFATVGGFSDFFSAFVSPDIRCYTRIFPFLGFFCVAAAATLLPPIERRVPAHFLVPLLLAIAVLAGYDQAVPSRANDHRQDMFRRDGEFVRQIETALPNDSMVFQLPYPDFPNEISPGKTALNDMLRPYLHSSKYRWSWPAVSGTTAGEWNRLAAGLPVPEMLHAIAQRGFSGLWIDQDGYAPGTSPEKAISTELGARPQLSQDGRFAFFDVRGYRSTAPSPVQVLFERGFYYEERGGGHVWHWSLRRGRLTLVNPMDTARRVSLSMHIQTPDGKPYIVRIAFPGKTDQVSGETIYRRTIDLPPSRPISVDLECDCPPVKPAGARALYFFVSDVEARD